MSAVSRRVFLRSVLFEKASSSGFSTTRKTGAKRHQVFATEWWIREAADGSNNDLCGQNRHEMPGPMAI